MGETWSVTLREGRRLNRVLQLKR